MATNPLNIDVHFLHRDPPVRVERHGANQQLATIYVDVAAEDSIYPVRLTLHGDADRLRRLLVDTLAKLDEAMQPDPRCTCRTADLRRPLPGGAPPSQTRRRRSLLVTIDQAISQGRKAVAEAEHDRHSGAAVCIEEALGHLESARTAVRASVAVRSGS